MLLLVNRKKKVEGTEGTWYFSTPLAYFRLGACSGQLKLVRRGEGQNFFTCAITCSASESMADDGLEVSIHL